MKKQILSMLLCICSVICFGQDEEQLSKLIEEGIALHDQGRYSEAIDKYTEAYKINPKSALVNYELSLSYMYLGDYENVIKHSNLVIESGEKDFLPLAYNALGSALDNVGRVEESIEVFEKALKEFGDNYLIYYNLALNYFNIKDYVNSRKMALKGLDINPSHSSSNLILAYSMQNLGKSAETILGFYFFLFLEGDTQRSRDVFENLLYETSKNVKKDADNENKINITLNGTDDDFSAANLMLALSEAARHTENKKDKTEYELFYDKTSLFFSTLTILEKNADNKADIWWNFYIPFFKELKDSGHLDAYCRYISQTYWSESKDWIQKNADKFNAFVTWLDSEYKWD